MSSPSSFCADGDGFEPGADGRAFGTVLHVFDLDDEVTGDVAADFELRLDRAGERGVAAWSGAFDAAMVNHDDGTVEGLDQGFGGVDIGGHVLVGAFAAPDAAVEGVESDDDQRRIVGAQLGSNAGDQGGMVAHQVERERLQIERHRVRVDVAEAFLLPGRLARLDAARAFECAIDDAAGMNAAAAIFSSDRDMHHHIERPE